MPRKTILVVDDEKPQRDILQEILNGAGYDVTSAASGEAALKFAKDRSFDLALTDLKRAGMDGIELLQQLLALDSSIIVILLTAHGTIDSAKDALRRGAFDYLQKPFDRERLLQTIKRALGTLDQIDVEIISASPKMEAVKKMILKVARSSSTVLIRGESGTGKELIARAIHNQSPRSSEMFQAVNCAAINENLLESELFGHEKGSFTGAHADKKGLFEVADRGTLFLDEIAELDVGMQAKLLRALQERRIRRVGGSHELPIDVRVVAATNRKSTRLNSSHVSISYAVFCLKKKKKIIRIKMQANHKNTVCICDESIKYEIQRSNVPNHHEDLSSILYGAMYNARKTLI